MVGLIAETVAFPAHFCVVVTAAESMKRRIGAFGRHGGQV